MYQYLVYLLCNNFFWLSVGQVVHLHMISYGGLDNLQQFSSSNGS